MKMTSINYFTLTGLLFVLMAGLILAGYPSAVKDTKKENTALFLGGDPYVKKNQMIRENEEKVGFCFLVLGTFLQIVGLLTEKGTLFWPSPCIGVGVCTIVAAVILLTIPPLTYKWWSFKEIKPYFVEKYKEDFKSIEKGDTTDITNKLDLIGNFIDIPRMKGESNEKYLERLRPYFIVNDKGK